MEKPRENEVQLAVQEWVEKVVLGLNLCPFAHDLWRSGNWDITVLNDDNKARRLEWAQGQVERFVSKAPEQKNYTSLLVFPQARENFIKFYNFSAMVEDTIAELGLKDKIQLVTFHPLFRFEGEKIDARGNYVNRSPYPLLHLLWEQDVTAVVEKLGENIGQKVAQENNNKLSSMSDDEFQEKVLKYVHSRWEVEKLT